ncbi:hypothetical protein FRB97_009578 [Tulasnella sp. 331]|nr:hypothetical protein FRB97_009578 [Tulasnella sp. 331]
MARITIIALSGFVALAGLCEAAVIPTVSLTAHITVVSVRTESWVLATPTPTSTSTPATSTLPTIWCDVIIDSPPIVAITTGTAVEGLELSSAGGSAALAATGYHQGWGFSNGGVGVFDGCHYLWLNIGESTASYKPLSFALDDQLSTNWSGGSTSPLVAGATTEYQATSTFLACQSAVAGQWTLYLQTGSDVPSGLECVDTQLELGPSTAIPIV